MHPFSYPSENDPLDELLKASPLPEPEAWFAAKTVAACRKEKISKGFFTRFLSLRTGVMACVVLGLSLLGVSSLEIYTEESQTEQKHAQVQEAFEVVASYPGDSEFVSDQDTSSL